MFIDYKTHSPKQSLAMLQNCSAVLLYDKMQFLAEGHILRANDTIMAKLQNVCQIRLHEDELHRMLDGASGSLMLRNVNHGCCFLTHDTNDCGRLVVWNAFAY